MIFGIKPQTTCRVRIIGIVLCKLYICTTKSKSSSSIVIASIFETHLVNGGQLLNATGAAVFPEIVTLPLKIIV